MKSKIILIVFLLLMAGLIIIGLFFPELLRVALERPALHGHVLFLHIFSVTLFFSHGLIGTLWELRSLRSGRKEIILHTYETVTWLDARLSSPLIMLSVLSGIMLSFQYGDFRGTGWLFWGFLLFLLSGALWVILDIPTQYKIKGLMENMAPEQGSLPSELTGLLRKRLGISLAGMLPLLAVFILMVYKPML